MTLFTAEKDNKCEEKSADLNALVMQIAEGSRNALEQLYRYTSSAVYSFALSVLKNKQDAEDVLHDCYLAVWHGAENYRPQGKALAWMMTIARNLCLQRIRERSRVTDLPPEEWAVSAPDDGLLTAEDRMVLSSCMTLLTEEEQQIVTLHAVSGFRHREIAELLELPLSTVLSKYHRAIKRLKKHLQ